MPMKAPFSPIHRSHPRRPAASTAAIIAEMEPDEVEAAMRDRDDDVFAQAAASAEVAP